LIVNILQISFFEHSYLWTDSRTEFMHYFLTYGRQLSPEEIEALEEDEKALKKQYPSLNQFREQIDLYEGLHEQLKQIRNIEIVSVRLQIKCFSCLINY